MLAPFSNGCYVPCVDVCQWALGMSTAHVKFWCPGRSYADVAWKTMGVLGFVLTARLHENVLGLPHHEETIVVLMLAALDNLLVCWGNDFILACAKWVARHVIPYGDPWQRWVYIS